VGLPSHLRTRRPVNRHRRVPRPPSPSPRRRRTASWMG